MRVLRGVLGFVVDFLVGDDPRLALGVAFVLGAGALAVLAGAPTVAVTLGGALLLATGFVAILLLDVKASAAVPPARPPT